MAPVQERQLRRQRNHLQKMGLAQVLPRFHRQRNRLPPSLPLEQAPVLAPVQVRRMHHRTGPGVGPVPM